MVSRYRYFDAIKNAVMLIMKQLKTEACQSLMLAKKSSLTSTAPNLVMKGSKGKKAKQFSWVYPSNDMCRKYCPSQRVKPFKKNSTTLSIKPNSSLEGFNGD